MNDLSKFKQIPGFSRYLISEDGIVYSIPRKRILKNCKNWAGYVTVTLVDDNNFRSPRRINRLVYLTYIGPIEKGNVIDHKDDNKLHNHYSNLQQITPSENSIKTFISGGNKDKVVWTDDMIKMICEMMENNIPSAFIFENIGIDYYNNRESCNHLIGQLRRGEIHKNIIKNYNIKDYISGINKADAKLSIVDVQCIYMKLLFGESAFSISKEYQVTYSTICKIRDKKTWKIITNKIDNYLFND